MDIISFFIHIHMGKLYENGWKYTFFNVFTSFFQLLKPITFLTFYPYMSHFKYWIWMKFSSFFPRKKSFFVKNQRFFVVFTIDNRFLTLNPSEKVLWTSKHHFWEVHFLWPKWNFTCKKWQKTIKIVTIFPLIFRIYNGVFIVEYIFSTKLNDP